MYPLDTACPLIRSSIVLLSFFNAWPTTSPATIASFAPFAPFWPLSRLAFLSLFACTALIKGLAWKEELQPGSNCSEDVSFLFYL